MEPIIERIKSTFGHQPSNDDADTRETPFTFFKLFRSYLGDWILVAALWFGLGYLYSIGGHKREFSLTDITIQRPFADPETVGSGMLMIISIGIPTLMVVLIGGVLFRNRWDIHNGVLGYESGALMGYTVTGIVTQIVKMGVGRPRPDLINRCLPIPGSVDSSVYGLSTYKICTQENQRLLNDGFKSFPSGHSSLSFAGLGFLSFYLAGKLHLADQRGHRTRAWLAFAPLLGSTMVAVSRTADNRHHWQDVTVGSILGLAISYVAYRAYFPPLSHRYAHLPLAPRPTSSTLFVPDDEESTLPASRRPLNLGQGDEAEEERLVGSGSGALRNGDRVVPRSSEDE